MAENKGMTVAKLLTGRDLPLSGLEIALINTYHLAKQRFQQQMGKGRH